MKTTEYFAESRLFHALLVLHCTKSPSLAAQARRTAAADMRTKYRVAAVLLLLLAALFITSCGEIPPDTSLSPMETEAEHSASGKYDDPVAEVRGIYIATVYNLDFPSRPGLDADTLASELDDIIENSVSLGFNAIYFQVRGASDAMYDSDIFPVSEYLTGKRGGTLPDGFDPLAYLIEKAHARGVAVHAWVNPLRITRGGTMKEPMTDTDELPQGSPARTSPELTFAYAGELYYDAGIPEVRRLVADGVSEIAAGYDVDGILFDDYFYPYPEDGCEIDDALTYEKYGNGGNIGDWRRDNINEMVKMCRDAVKATDPDCLFGIAPFGIWRNNDGANGGSDTRGFESYDEIFCDTLEWVRKGYVDYVAPQIYWSFSKESAPFGVLTDWWCAQLDGTDTGLLISHAAYKYGTDEWKFAGTVSELREQLTYSRRLISYRGSIIYGYSELCRDTDGAASDVKESFEDDVYYVTPIPTGSGVDITYPAYGSSLTDDTVTLHGTSAPEYPVYCNGAKIARRRGGEFYLTVKLSEGENLFEFINGGEKCVFMLIYHEKSVA